MCGRFVTPEVAEIERFWHIGRRNNIGNLFAGLLQTRFNVAPQQGNPQNYIPVVRADPDGTLELTYLQWWLLPFWSKEAKVNYSMFNARVESIATSSSFREPFRKRRCLVPAKGYYEWEETPDGKQPWFFHAPDNSLLAFAGIWDHWARDGQVIESCAIIVGDPDPAMGHKHDRAPFIIPPENQGAWLNRELHDPDDVKKLLVTASASPITSHRVSRAVSNVLNQGPELIEPVPGPGTTPPKPGDLWPNDTADAASGR